MKANCVADIERFAGILIWEVYSKNNGQFWSSEC